jgi:hypothetical protein
MNWFGEDWGGAICIERPEVPVPVGEPCVICGDHIKPGDYGLTGDVLFGSFERAAYHLLCFLAAFMPCGECDQCQEHQRSFN